MHIKILIAKHFTEKLQLLLIKDINLMHEAAQDILRQWIDHGFWIDKHMKKSKIKV
jgi:predicted transcriptional regulator